MRYFILTSLMILMISCGGGESGPTEGLTLIPRDQIVQRTKAGKFDYRYGTFKNQKGKPLNSKEQKMLNDGLLGKDYYEDAQGVIKEIVIRPVELEDKLIDIQRREIASKPLNGIALLDIDCSKVGELYVQIDSSDQAVRANKGDIAAVDTQNLQLLISAITKCGWSEKHMKTVFMVLRHSPVEVMSYYYEDLTVFSKKGIVSKASIAMIQDEMLSRHGYKQVYGTQLFSKQLYKLENPDQVNERRKEVGLSKIEDFLKIWGLDFEKEKERLRKEEME